jgi:two-component system, NtrC family, response regulator
VNTARILIVEDDVSLRRVIQAQIAHMGVDVSTAGDVPGALKILESANHELVMTDLNLPGLSGLDLLRTVRTGYPETTVVLMTAYGSVQTAVEAMKNGAYDYLTKPVRPNELIALINRVLERTRLIQEVRTLRSMVDDKFGFEGIRGHAKNLLRVLSDAAHIAMTDATILILGETGTGKELLAKAIHLNSRRRTQPFVVINCGAIPHELLESELFGYVRGAFTGAFTHKKGKLEMADGGAVFLDEIGEMPLDLQVRLLRVVQEREIEKLGSSQQIKVDVRIIAATNRNLEKMVEEGKFREDLYYRLSVVPLTLPPLRERKEDIPELVEQFFAASKLRYGKETLKFPSHLMPYFQNSDWNGNVRELENVVARLVLLSHDDEITVSDLPSSLHQIRTDPSLQVPVLPTEGVKLEDMERNLIVAALNKFNGNQSNAAKYLSITRKVLINRIAKFQIRGTGRQAKLQDEPQENQSDPDPAGLR